MRTQFCCLKKVSLLPIFLFSSMHSKFHTNKTFVLCCVCVSLIAGEVYCYYLLPDNFGEDCPKKVLKFMHVDLIRWQLVGKQKIKGNNNISSPRVKLNVRSYL